MMLKTTFANRLVLSLILSYNAVLGLDPTVVSFDSEIEQTDAFLECIVDNVPSTAFVEISKITPEGPVIITEEPGKYRLVSGKHYSVLMIMSISSDDAGDYRCTISDDDVDQQSWPYKQLTLNYKGV